MKKSVLIFSAVTLVLPFTTASAGQTLQVVKVAAVPSVDGSVEDVWASAPETVISLAKIPQEVIDANKQHQKGKYAKNWGKDKFTQTTELKLKAVRTDDQIFFLALWSDDSKDDQHKPWKWEGDKASGEYLSGKEREDRLSFMFPISGTFSTNKLSGAEMVADVWQWKAARTNGVGIAHDKRHITTKTKPKGKSTAHFTPSGDAIYVSRPGDGPAPYESNKIDPFTFQGDMVQRYIPTKPGDPDAEDVAAKGAWAEGTWTVEWSRKLDTGHKDQDTKFDVTQGTSMGVAVFNRVGDHFHAVSSDIKVVFD